MIPSRKKEPMGLRKITNIKKKPDIIDRSEIIDILNLVFGIWYLEFGIWDLAFGFRVSGPFGDGSLVTSPN